MLLIEVRRAPAHKYLWLAPTEQFVDPHPIFIEESNFPRRQGDGNLGHLGIGPEHIFMALPSILVILVTIVFLILERAFPGRDLPKAKAWYRRALLINLAQLAITLSTVRLWIHLFGVSLLKLSSWHVPVAEGFVGWFVGTFFFYWWHVVRHKNGFWLIFHQVHHSPSRIEVATSFYKHPLEILSDSILSALVLYPLLGCSIAGAFWYNFFAATGEYFYHANLKSPRWLRFFIQTPELHSIHHEYDVHNFNFSDIPVWDRLFGTYRDTTEFAARCGFPAGAEDKLAAMLAFEDVYPNEAAEMTAP